MITGLMIAEIVYEHSMPTWLIWVMVIAAVAVGVYTFWRYIDRQIYTYVLAGLWAIFLGLMVWCLLMPGLKNVETHKLKPRFVVALDTSESMLLSPSEDVSNRWHVATQILDQSWTKTIKSECDIDAYSFDNESSRKMKLEEVRKLAPEGKSTLLRDCIKKVTGRYGGLNVAAGLLISDGIDTREAFDDWSTEVRPFPLYTVMLEPEEGWEEEPDVRIDTVNTPRRVTVDWKTELKAVVSGQGTKGQPIVVQLFKNDRLIEEQPTQVAAGGGSKEVMFELEHPEIGVFTYRVYLPPFKGEKNTNDNEYAVSVQVIDSKNRMIYVEGPPRWESKYLTRALRSNRQITPLIFLRGPEQKFMTFGTRGSMTPDLKKSQLVYFKIVLLGNLSAEELGNERATNLLKFVEDGGSLIILGGSQAWGEKGLSETVLKKLLPVKSYTKEAIEEQIEVKLTDAGRSHPIFAGDPSVWMKLPPVISLFPDAKISPGAQTLVEARTDKGMHPMVVVQRYGQGKVVAIFTDSLWKWRLNQASLEAKPYQRFWDQMISWLLPKEKELEEQQLELFADREQAFLGEEVELSCRGGEGLKDIANINMTCEITGPDKRKLPFSMNKQEVRSSTGKIFPGFVFKYKTEKAGLHTAKAVTTIDDAKVESEPISFYVKPFSPESVPRPSNVDVLKAIAAASGGKFFKDLDALNDEISAIDFIETEEERAEYDSLWQNWPIFLGLVTLLCVGWVMRKLRNMV